MALGTAQLTNPRFIKDLLQRHGTQPRHYLGQNFLVDYGVLQAIVTDLAPSAADLVLEIGPGIGNLTRALAERAGRVVAVEIDLRMVAILKETVGDCTNVEVIASDALRSDLQGLLTQRLPAGGSALLAANLPYYITTPLIMRFLEERLPLRRLVVMVQREVAERIVAAPGGKEYGVLSIAVQYYTQPRLVRIVRRGSFWPAPAVDSAVLSLAVRAAPPVAAVREPFFRVVRAAFSQRRKTLANTLSAGLGLPKEVIIQSTMEAGIDPQRRAETLSLAEFSTLTLALGPRWESQSEG